MKLLVVIHGSLLIITALNFYILVEAMSIKEEFNLEEESSQGTIVGTINTSKLNIPSNSQLSYSLFLPSKIVKSYFQIERTSGKIVLQRTIDREKDGRKIDKFSFSVRITLQDGQHEYVSIIIHIIDINDFVPTFSQSKFVMNIPESSVILQNSFPLPQAVDKDSYQNNIKLYRIVPKDDTKQYFQLLYTKQETNQQPIKPYLKQIKALDRERVDKLRFKLQAIDRGEKIGETNIEIIVTDQNDNYPQFIGLPYRTNVSECTKPGEEIFRLRAKDGDFGKNQEISFKISELASDLISSTFHMSSMDRVLLSRPLDYEEMPRKLKIPIVATDGGGLSNTTEIEVWIEDCNDNVVTISIYIEPEANSGTYTKLKENDPKRRPIAMVVTRDPDSGLNGDVACHLSDMNGHSNNFELKFDRKYLDDNAQVKYFNLYKPKNIVFDRESKPRYELKISCNDQGNLRHENSKMFIIDIEDENDCRPQFTRDFTFYIGENNLQGARVGTVEATDGDYGKNSRITYQIVESEYKKYFDIDVHGRISALVTFDREERDVYNFTVIASDSGTPKLSANTSVIVKITDKNDCNPEYHGLRNFYIYESNGTRHVGYNLGKLNATDRDLGENSSLRFFLPTHFGVEPRQVRDCYHLSEDGVLTVRGLLDREKFPIHKLNITISDRGYPISLNSHALITVTLRDVNDNRPKFVSDTRIKMITPEMTRGTELLKLRAEDEDEGENKTVTFSLMKSGLSDYFTLSPDGTLMLAKPYDSKRVKGHLQNYNLQVIAKDGGNLTSRAYLRGSFQVLRPPVGEDGRNRGNKGMHANDNFAELNQENNLLILLCVAATVVLIFVVVVIVFGYTYLKGDTICFPRRNSTRYSGSYDSTASKLPRHAAHEENSSDKACFNSLLPAGKIGCPISNCSEQDCDHMTQSGGDYSTKSGTLNCQYYKELCHTLDGKLSGKEMMKPSSHSTFTSTLSKSKSQTSDISKSTLDRAHTINRSILKCDDTYRSNDYTTDRLRSLRYVADSLPVVDATHVYTELESSRLNEFNNCGKEKLNCSTICTPASMARQPKITSSFV